MCLFWLLYDVIAVFLPEDPLPLQGIILCLLGSLGAVSLLLVFIRPRIAGLTTIIFSVSNLVGVVFYNRDSFGLIIFCLIVLILPLLIPAGLLLFRPKLGGSRTMA